ncbi:3'(2'),5'-bisphosphate nucleotidase CysQ [Sphingomonas sp. KR1UV-12]|uniref:3'(2'),5'-bisphosphate nucleotidase CysQ n=1 Tax=Sphingomonas aurea TaxID=3063994 RepID=A0ABT9EMK5_9SPHN|nr:3'(2'),5'-bisphosphate nucleotidase CysQ [Sphingomonas sp. KR1UV-12]MDP1028036.1 3'(2'),5'-bisphosphate nucleotidase CysQ [Sphingomonas sp. KR1UV-12]
MAEADGFDIERMIEPVLAAGARTLVHRAAGVVADTKADASPVTVADREAEAILLAALAAQCPDIPVVAEEEAAAGRVPDVGGRWFFLVDPLDGTKEYVGGGTDFTVNVALIDGEAPVAGIVYAPARGQLWCGTVGRGAWATEVVDGAVGARAPLKVRDCAGAPVAVASKSHCTPATEAWLAASGCGARVSVGSSLKFALIAAGEADVYPRAGPTMEWDTAAGDAILRAAGGRTLCLDGQPLTYRKARYFNPGFVASGGHACLPLRPFVDDGK